jgi:replication factor C subunit 2/4
MHDSDSGSDEDSDDKELKLLLRCTEGDLRRGVMLLQSAHRLATVSPGEQVVTCEMICELAGVIPSEVIEDSMQILTKNDGMASLLKIMQYVRKTLASGGYGSTQFLSQLSQRISNDATLGAKAKAECSLALAHTDHMLVDGGDEVIQLTALLSSIHRILNTSPSSANHDRT